jgi:DNA-binding NarL/FixJ family response regulator
MAYRIIAADSTHLVPNIASAAVELVERDAIVIAVQSGEVALAEIKRGGIDLLVSAFNLTDMRGFELALKANKQDPQLPVIILASAEDPIVDEKTQDESPFHYLVRGNEGARFVHVLRALLDGEDPKEEEVTAPPAVMDMGPVPEVDVAALSDSLSTILTDVGAMAVVLVDRKGNILQEMGAVGYMDRDRLTSTLAPNFANMASIGPLVGSKEPQAMHFYDGDEFDIFALAVGLHHFICLIFEGSAGSRAFGSVTMYGRRVVPDMLEIMGSVAFETQVIMAKPEPKAEPAKATRKGRKQAEPEPVPAKPAEEEAYVPPRPPSLEPLPEDADLEAMLAGLDKLDMAQADTLFDPDKLAEIAAEKMAGEKLTLEEAQQMGVMQS